MQSQSCFHFLQRLLARFGGWKSTAACPKRPYPVACRLRVEPLEDRRLLSVAPTDGLGVALASHSPVAWDTVIHDDDGDLFAIDLAQGAGGGAPLYLGKTIDSLSGSVVVMSDMAYSRVEDCFYGVTYSSLYYDTSSLWRVTIDTSTYPSSTVTTTFVSYIWADDPWPAGVPVHLNALEFANGHTKLFAAGVYDWVDTHDWTFEIDLDTYVAQRHMPLWMDDQGYHSAGDIEFDCHGEMYVTTSDDYGAEGKGALLKITDPLLATPTIHRVGYTGYTDFSGVSYDPSNRLLGYLKASHELPPQANRREVRRIALGDAHTNHFCYLYDPELDNIFGVATTRRCPPGITVTPTAGLITTEAGGTASFTVVLDTGPWANVTIDISSSDTTEGTVSTERLTFTPDDWFLEQTVTVTGVDDFVDDGEIIYTILLQAAVSDDPDYSNRNADDVSVTNVDDDTAGIRVSPTYGLVTDEGGRTAQFEVVLHSQPTDDVTIHISSNDPSEGTVTDPASGSLTFTEEDWHVSRTVTVTGQDDDQFDGHVAYAIETAPAVSGDLKYRYMDADDVELINEDNEPPLGDLGDAPDHQQALRYPTLLANDGAHHIIVPDFYLGAGVDAEYDGQPTTGADGDDNDPKGDDEDGVVFDTLLIPYGVAKVTVTASAAGNLDVWIDFNGDGDWDEPGEQIFASQLLSTGGNELFFPVPPDAKQGMTFARFRFSSAGGLSYTGVAADGEVEDYRVQIGSERFRPDPAGLVVYGSDGPDVFEFTSSDNYTVRLNDEVTLFPAVDFDTVTFLGGLGDDSAVFNGTANPETAEFWPNRGQFSGDGILVTAENVTSITANTAGGGDVAVFHDSHGDDTFKVWPNSASIQGPGSSFSHQATGVAAVHAYATESGVDTAQINDSPGDDIFIGMPQYAELFAPGFHAQALYFENVRALADNDGVDMAFLHDSPTDDVFNSTDTPEQGRLARLSGQGFELWTGKFEYVLAYADAGGYDKAFLAGSPGDDTMIARPKSRSARLYGDGFNERVKYFDAVYAEAIEGGHDVAYMYDTPSTDYFFGTPAASALVSTVPQTLNVAKSFDEVYAEADPSHLDFDLAFLYDSPADDLLEAEDSRVRLSDTAGSFLCQVSGYDFVWAHCTSGTNTKRTTGPLQFILYLTGPWQDP